MPIEVITDGVTLDESNDRHDYRLHGQHIPGCSAILEHAGLISFNGVPKATLKAKSDLGTAVHEYCRFWDENDLDLDDLKPYPAYYSRTLGWVQFVEDYGCKFLLIEKSIAIKVNGMFFGVKPDRFALGKFKADGTEMPGVVEIKNSAQIQVSHRIQTAAQAIALKEENPIPARLVVQLAEEPDKQGKFYRVHTFTDSMDERVFLWALGLEWFRINNKIRMGE